MIIQITNFRGDLSDISVKTVTLATTPEAKRPRVYATNQARLIRIADLQRDFIQGGLECDSCSATSTSVFKFKYNIVWIL